MKGDSDGAGEDGCRPKNIGQNLLLMATSLGLGSVPKGSFDPKAVGELLNIPTGQSAVYMICVGKVN